jgi:TonB family protein
MASKFILSVCLIWATVPPSFAADRAEKELEKSLKEQILVLRRPIGGTKIDFEKTGVPITEAPGSLEFDSVIQIRKVNLGATDLTLEGVRLWPYYDEKQKKIAFNRTDGKVRIRVARSSDESVEALKASLARVFLNVSEMESQFFKPMETAFADTNVFRVGNGVSPPQPIYQPEAAYSPEARRDKKAGVVLLQVIVAPDGRTRNIQVKRPLGSGLDESAVAAVKTWRFQPAIKDSKPVAVVLNIEIGFYLY